MDISLDDLRAYARCPLEWFWERRAGLSRPPTIAALVPVAIRTGLSFYYGGHANDLAASVGLVWQDWCEGWGEAALALELAEYAVGRAKILNLFATGRVHRPDGGRYAVPEMTNEYRSRMHSAGLTHRGRKLDEFAQTHGLLTADEEDRPGSALGDAFATCLAAAERVMPDMPARNVVLGWQVPYRVNLGDGVHLTGSADLVVEAPGDPGVVILEVHDFEATPWIRAGLAGRDLRVIAASLAEPTARNESDGTSVTWQQVTKVTFRHWPTGQTFNFRETNSGHLLALVASIARGMRHHVVIPRAVTGYDTCRNCAYREHCWSGAGWDALPLIDPGMLGFAEQMRTVFQQFHETPSQNGATAHHTNEAIALLEEVLQEAGNPDDERAILEAGRLVVKPSDHNGL